MRYLHVKDIPPPAFQPGEWVRFEGKRYQVKVSTHAHCHLEGISEVIATWKIGVFEEKKSMSICPYGGNCVDPGNPSDCWANDHCMNFNSVEEKHAFDCLPDKFYFQFKEGGIVKFKTSTQLNFLVADLSAQQKEGAKWGTINDLNSSELPKLP